MAQQTINIGSSANDPTAESVRSAFNKTNGNFTELYAAAPTNVWQGHNVLAYGAVGNAHYSLGGGNDDTTAIQNAINAAAGSGGYWNVVFPGGRTYRITSTLNVTRGVHLIGLGGRGSSVASPPVILWDGSNLGTIVQVSDTTYITGTYFENICIQGGAGITNQPACALKFTGTGIAAVDSGCGLRDVWFQCINGDALRFEIPVTNFFIDGGRFDAIYGGYAIYADLNGKNFSCNIQGNTNYVGGGASNGKGFLFLNGEGSSGGESHVTIQGLKSEVNQDLMETYASGTNPSDKQGLIRLGVNPAAGNLQHNLSIDGWRHSTGSGLKSFSAFQITATSGAASDAVRCSRVTLDGYTGLHNFNAADSGTTNERRMFGGLIPAGDRFPWLGYRHGQILWGAGKLSSYEGVRSWIRQDYGTYAIRGLRIDAETVADLGSPVGGVGSLAAVTDATSPTIGNTVAGGGSAKALVWYNGTNWTVIGK